MRTCYLTEEEISEILECLRFNIPKHFLPEAQEQIKRRAELHFDIMRKLQDSPFKEVPQ